MARRAEGADLHADIKRLWARRERTLGNAQHDWYRILNAQADEAEIYIYGEIAWWDISAATFVRELQGVSASKIVVHLNTPGGDVFDGIAIYTALRDHPAEIETRVDSLAASIGSVIAMAGDRVVMARHSTMMVHEPWGLAIGNADDMRKLAEVLDRLADTIAAIYAEKAGTDVADWRAAMAAETWYTDREAVDAGLADEVAGDPPAGPRDVFDLSMFRHPPRPETRDLEGAGDPHPTPPGVVGEGGSSKPQLAIRRRQLDLRAREVRVSTA